MRTRRKPAYAGPRISRFRHHCYLFQHMSNKSGLFSTMLAEQAAAKRALRLAAASTPLRPAHIKAVHNRMRPWMEQLPPAAHLNAIHITAMRMAA